MLMQVSLPVVSKSECSKADPYYAAWHDSGRRWTCTGGREEKGTCFGDSGGPAMVAVGKEFWIVGVTSRQAKHALRLVKHA